MRFDAQGWATLTDEPGDGKLNAYGATEISDDGTVMAGNSSAFSSSLSMNGGNLALEGNSLSLIDVNGASGQIVNGGANSATLTIATPAGETDTYGGMLADGGGSPLGLEMTGAGVLNVNGGNTFTGPVQVDSGVLATSYLNAPGSPQGIGEGNGLTLDGGTFRYTGGNFGWDGDTQFGPSITVGLQGGVLDTTGGYAFYSGSLTGSGPLTFLDSSGGNNNWLITGNSPAFSGSIAIGDGSSGSGLAQVRSDNPRPLGTGTITVNGGGTLTADNGQTDPSDLANPIDLNGGFLATQAPDMTYSGDITVGAGTASTIGWTHNGGGDVILGGSLLGSGTISTVGGRNVQLAGDDSGFTGTWESSGAQTWFDAAYAGSDSATWVAAGSDFIANILGGGVVDLGCLSGDSGMLTSNAGGATAAFSVGAMGQDMTFGGAIADNPANPAARTALVKIGGGTLTLTGPNTSTGGATIEDGTLQIGDGSTNGQFGGGAYDVAPDARLLLDYATAVRGGSGTWSNQIIGGGTVELNSAQPDNATADWGPNTPASQVFSDGFTGTLQIDNGRIDASPSSADGSGGTDDPNRFDGLGGVTNIVIDSGAQFLAWSGTYDQSITIAGDGWGEAGFPGALRAAPGDTTWTGNITLAGTSTDNMATILAQYWGCIDPHRLDQR